VEQRQRGLPVFQPAGLRPYSSVQALVIDPTNSSTLYAAPGLALFAGGGVYRSTDGAASWSAINSGLPDNFFIGSWRSTRRIRPRCT